MDLWRENGFESKRLINYYTELSADVLILGCTLLQYLQLMVKPSYYMHINIVI